MKIHKEGYKIIFIIFVVLALAVVIINLNVPRQTFIHYIIYAAALIFFAFIVRFFRNPLRAVEIDDTLLLSPADGKVVYIDEVEETEYFKDRRLLLSIFMSPNNVHKNWYPVSGKIVYYRHHPGRFLVAWHPKSSDLNERTTIVLERNNGSQILLRQIAGAVAQRIICYAEEEQMIEQGQELGFIKFGSRVDLFLPLGTKVLVKRNQKVKGCRDVLVKFD